MRDFRQIYYKLNSRFYGETMCAFYPDDRTIVVDHRSLLRFILLSMLAVDR